MLKVKLATSSSVVWPHRRVIVFARMAVLHARGEMQAGDRFIGYSIVGSRFDCTILNCTSVGNVVTIIPTIRGRGWITGTHQLMCDPEDPWPCGYRLTDTWPKRVT